MDKATPLAPRRRAATLGQAPGASTSITGNGRRFSTYRTALMSPVAERVESAQSSGNKNTIAMSATQNRACSNIPEMILSDTTAAGGVDEAEQKNKKAGFKALIRRASVSIKNAKNRRFSTSHLSPSSSSDRPSTSASMLGRVKRAVSFSKPPAGAHHEHPYLNNTPAGFIPAVVTGPDVNSHMPVPGQGDIPPFVPSRFGGEAARATAAEQNALFQRMRLLDLQEKADSAVDNDSANSFTFTPTSSARNSQASETPIVKPKPAGVDFTKKFPAELSTLIFSHLNAGDLKNCERVSKNFKKTVDSNYVWKESAIRECSKTITLGHDVEPGSGMGIPGARDNKDWKQVYKANQELKPAWKAGKAKTVRLDGHQDSVYCLQFDE